MHPPRTALAVALLSLFAGCAQRKGGGRPVAPVAVEARLGLAERARRSDPSIRELLGSADEVVRARAALAAGRIQSAEVVPELAANLAGEEAGSAAWALGRIKGGEPVLVRCVLERCPGSTEAARALGGPGRGPEVIPALAAALDGPAQLAAESALALGIIARVGGKGAENKVRDAAGSALVAALSREKLSVRTAAAYALGRMATTDAGPRLMTPISAALADADAELRALAARAAGKQGAFAAALDPLLHDADWRVRVEVARALATAPGGPEALTVGLPAAIRDAAGKGLPAAAMAHALIAHLEALGKAGGAAAASVPMPSTLQAATPAATVAVRCAAAAARDRASGEALLTAVCGKGLEPEWRGRARTAALAAELTTSDQSPSRGVAITAFSDDDARVRSAAAGSAGAPLAEALGGLLSDPDPFVVASAAGSLAKDPKLAARAAEAAAAAIARLSAAKGKGAGDPAADALVALVQLLAAQPKPLAGAAPGLAILAKLLPVGSPALFRALDEALPALGGEKLDPGSAPAPAAPADASLGLPGNGPRPSRLILETTAGKLVVALHTGDGEAPLTSAAIAALAGRHFYDGLSWHRVVPDFVIQGGDPRGDGDGGPGWSLPDEHTPLRFRRGTLGIATSGPETGGSQIFLCHSPQPHLDGRYTIAGELISGADVMDAIHVGDSIVSARVE